jgi:uncharacterized protein YfaS (alpha-2-macroglobulin family)
MPDLTAGRSDADLWTHVRISSQLSQPHRRGQTYVLPLPEVLKAYTTYHLEAEPQQITDVFGRLLAQGIRMQFVTDHRPPHYRLAHPMSVLEQSVDTHVPLIVTNLDTIHLRYETLTAQGRHPAQDHTISVDKAEDIAYAMPLKVRELLLATSGAIQGTLRTTPAVGNEPQWFFSQVTPFNVHVKLGHYNTLVWVTRFDSGLPVSEAQVQVYVDTFGTFDANPMIRAEAETNPDGIAMLAGINTLDPNLEVLNTWQHAEPHLFVRVRHHDDLALVPLTYDLMVQSYGPNRSYMPVSWQRRYGHIHAWGTTAQGVYKAGDTVQYIVYVRDQDNERFVPAPRTGYTLHVVDPTGKTVHEIADLSLSDFGAHHGTFTVPQNGAVGWYRFVLSATFDGQEHSWEPLRVLISDFTPAPFRVSTELHGTLFTPEDMVAVTTQATLHAGGPYAEAPTRLTARVQGRPLQPQDPQAAGFTFDVLDDTGTETVYQSEDRVNAMGMLQTSFPIREAKALHGQLVVESAVRDDRGKYVASQATARYVGRDRYVGLHQPDWVLTAGSPAHLQLLVVSTQGIAVAGTPIQVRIEYLDTKAARVKGAGNAYLTRYVHTWVYVAACALISKTTPEVCTFTPQVAGTYKMTASIVDTHAREHHSSIQRWALGAGQVLWETAPGHGLQISPEKAAYKIGDTARYLVQNPYPGARALVTIERYGVQKSWLQTFANSLGVVEVPITPEHLPGFYLSVVVMSPRVDKPLEGGQVDLGKPAFRMGYVRVPVHDDAKELVVEVQPQQPVYKPRQTATVDLSVRTRQGDRPPLELAVAVLDEAVFDLIAAGRDYFDPYKGFYTLDPLDLRNYSLLTHLIGRQKFEKKGANPGGGGGADLDLRSLFTFVSYWNPSLTPDASGKATISFPLPDNLTGWRVLAMAMTREDRMGLGEGHFKVNQPTEIRPSLPNQVAAADRFEARFTVMNRTETARLLDVALRATGPIAASDGVQRQFLAEPYTRYTVGLPVHALHAGTITLQARAGDTQDRDALAVSLPVRARQALETVATYGSTTANVVQETIAFPTDMRTDIGHVGVVASPTVIGGLEGAFTYVRDYPYICWEQVLTKGVMAAHYNALKAYLPDHLQWPDSHDLPQRTLALAANYQAANGGMTYYIPQETYVSPYLSAYTALAFNWLQASGYAIPAQIESRLHDYLLTLLRRDVMPDFYSPGMISTVRAVALAALAGHGKLSRADLQRYRRHVPAMSLFGKAHYLLALSQTTDTSGIQAEVIKMLQAHANESSGKFIFSEAIEVEYQHLLDSPLRSNCAILSAFLAANTPDQSHDIPFKLVRTITQSRQNRDRWENTQENIFCMNALVDFSRAYEQDKPQMRLRATLDDIPLGEAQFRDYQDGAVDLQRPLRANDPGRTATLTVTRAGSGRLYYAARLSYATSTLRSTAVNAGIEVHREYSVERDGRWMLLRNPMQIAQGELVRVDLYVSLPAARNFVVVDDPVPGGLEPVNRDLGTASRVDADKAALQYADGSFWFQYDDWRSYGYTRWSFYHQELRHHAVRFYSEYLPAGRYHLAYVAQAIAPGAFTVLPTHAEEMYDADTFGQGVPAMLHVLAE